MVHVWKAARECGECSVADGTTIILVRFPALVQAFGLVFCFEGFAPDYLKKAGLYALLWALPVSTANAVMFVMYHKSDSIVPRIVAISTSGCVFAAYLIVIFLLRKGDADDSGCRALVPQGCAVYVVCRCRAVVRAALRLLRSAVARRANHWNMLELPVEPRPRGHRV